MKIVEFHVNQPSQMRYKTVGDWYSEIDKETNAEKVIISTVDMGDMAMNFLVLTHEFVEYMLCNADGISQEAVDEYDFEYQDEQTETELGENEDAPYHKQHMIADGVERILCQLLGVEWNAYATKVEEKFDEVDAAISEAVNAEDEAKELAEGQVEQLSRDEPVS